MAMLKIENGTIVDPINHKFEFVGDLWVQDGRIVSPPVSNVPEAQTIDATGRIVLPGGIDIHCHIAGPKVNTARKMFPVNDERPNALVGGEALMTTTRTGLRYAGLGYTTAFDAAVPALMSRHAHMELDDTPCLDTGIFTLVGNNHFVMERIRDGNHEALKNFLGWLLNSTGAYAPKLVNPGGVEKWKRDGTNQLGGIDAVIDNDRLTPRAIIEAITRAANAMELPHPVHLHCNDLGRPGNWNTTLETMKTIGGLKAHLTHIQFHSYGEGDDDANSFHSKVKPLVEYLNANPNLSVDVGQVMFGKTASLTGDGALGEFLYRTNGKNWYCHDVELEAGCGISPLVYKHKSAVSALQWMIGLEWFLSAENLWQVCLSTDHPNGGSFMAYPQLIAFLMSADKRRETMAKFSRRALMGSSLPEINREFSLMDVAIVTRAAPARILGLKDKGHLGVGADADITIYERDDDIERMFRFPVHVIKSGTIIVNDGDISDQAVTSLGAKRRLSFSPHFDPDITDVVYKWLEQFGTVSRTALEIQ